MAKDTSGQVGNLILSRRCGEAIIIDGNVRVAIEHISPTKVRMSIQAPGDVTVLREEVFRSTFDTGEDE